MAGKVLLINHGATLMANALSSILTGMDIETVRVEPEIDQIDAHKDGTDVFLMFAGDYVYGAPELFVYLKDLCFSEKKFFCVVGYEKELAEVSEHMPRNLIARKYTRPIDVKRLSTELRALICRGEALDPEKRILLVDDDVTFLQLMQSWLGTKYRVTIARSGMQAIGFLSTHETDLILLDYDMPITPGPQVLEMIRSEPETAKIPVIFLTGKDDRNSVMSVMRLKPEGYLLKSMSKAEIMSSVDRFFESQRLESTFG